MLPADPTSDLDLDTSASGSVRLRPRLSHGWATATALESPLSASPLPPWWLTPTVLLPPTTPQPRSWLLLTALPREVDVSLPFPSWLTVSGSVMPRPRPSPGVFTDMD